MIFIWIDIYIFDISKYEKIILIQESMHSKKEFGEGEQ